MGAKTQAFDIFPTHLISHYPLPLSRYVYRNLNCDTKYLKIYFNIIYVDMIRVKYSVAFVCLLLLFYIH